MFPKNYWEDPDPLGLDVPEEDDRERCTHGALEGDCDACSIASCEHPEEWQLRQDAYQP